MLSRDSFMNIICWKHEAEQALASEPTLGKGTWKNIKDFVYNLVKKNTKLCWKLCLFLGCVLADERKLMKCISIV